MAEQDETVSVDEAPYEKVMELLCETVEALERGDLSLEEQIRRFEEGVRLVRRGQALLDQAERKVEILLKGDRTETFGIEEDGEEEGEA
ncbi:MAG: exodeoxyribonuclease VII small subunit [Myxococcota bacterium]